METPSFSNEADSAWEGSDNQDGIYVRSASAIVPSSSQILREMEPEFPPKPVWKLNYSKIKLTKLFVRIAGCSH